MSALAAASREFYDPRKNATDSQPPGDVPERSMCSFRPPGFTPAFAGAARRQSSGASDSYEMSGFTGRRKSLAESSGTAAGFDNLNSFNQIAARDSINHFHPARDLAEDGVTAVQMRLWRMRDEKLAAASILAR